MREESILNYPGPGNGGSEIIPLNPVMNIGIEKLRIWRDDGGIADGGQGTNILFKNAVNCWVRGVSFLGTCRNHVEIFSSAHVEISGCYFEEANDYGSGGHGYGTLLTNSSTNCLIENNCFKKLRHAIVLQVGAMCNVISFNYSYWQYWTAPGIGEVAGDYILFNWGPGGDICFHGNYPYYNLIEHNYCERIVADAHHGHQGNYNLIIRNRVTNDFDFDKSWIYLKLAFNTSVLGNMESQYNAAEVEYASCSAHRDIFGTIPNDGTYSHNIFNSGSKHEGFAYMLDESYYYSTRPYFLDENYTWPTIGPEVTGGISLSQTIPARVRINAAPIGRTYINPATGRIFTTSGTMAYDQWWKGSINLTGNVLVPNGIRLFIDNDAILNLNGFNIVSGGGTITNVCENISPRYIKLTNSGQAYGEVEGLYSTIPAALAAATIGQKVTGGYATYTLDQNWIVPDLVELSFNDGSTIQLGSFYIRCPGSGFLVNFQDCTIMPRDIYSGQGDPNNRKGQYPSLQSALDNAVMNQWVNFSGTHTGNLTMNRTVHLWGTTANAEIDGSLTVNATGWIGLWDFHLVHNLTVNSCLGVYCLNMVMDETVFLNYSDGLFEDSENIGIGGVNSKRTKVNGSYLDAFDYDMENNYVSCQGAYVSDLEFFGGSMGGSYRGLILLSTSQAYLQDLTFCANSNLDIYAPSSSGGTFADAYLVSQWSGDPAVYTFGNVDYPEVYTTCTSLGKPAAPKLAHGAGATNSILTDAEEGMDEYKTIAKEIRDIRKELSKELSKVLKENEKLDKEKYRIKFDPYVKELQKLVEKYPAKKSAKLSLAKIKHTLFATEDHVAFAAYVETLVKDKKLADIHPLAKGLLIPCFLRDMQFDQAISHIDALLHDYPENDLCKDWLFSKGMIYKYSLDNKAAGDAIFEEIIRRWLDDPIAEWAQDELDGIGKPDSPETGETTKQLPTKFSLASYPNPFNPTTTIEFTLPKAGDVTIEIYDITGRCVTTLLSAEREAGIHKIEWNATNEAGNRISSGVYFCHVSYDNQVLNKKLVLMR